MVRKAIKRIQLNISITFDTAPPSTILFGGGGDTDWYCDCCSSSFDDCSGLLLSAWSVLPMSSYEDKKLASVWPHTSLGGTRTAIVRISSRSKGRCASGSLVGSTRDVGFIFLYGVHALLSHGHSQLPNIAATTHGPRVDTAINLCVAEEEWDMAGTQMVNGWL